MSVSVISVIRYDFDRKRSVPRTFLLDFECSVVSLVVIRRSDCSSGASQVDNGELKSFIN